MKYTSELTEKIVNDYAAKYLKKHSSAASYRAVVESICSYCQKDLIKIDSNDAEAFFAYAKQISRNDDTTLNFKRSVLLSIASYMEKNRKEYGLMPYDYTDIYRSLHFETLEYVDPSSIPSLKDVDRLISYLRLKRDYRTLLAVSLALKCALTSSEILAISFDDFIMNDNNEKMLCVHNPNFPKPRYIVLPVDLIKIIDLYYSSIKDIEKIRYNPGQKIFIKSNHKPIAYRMLSTNLKTACTEIGVSITFNGLRNMAVTYMIKNGASEEEMVSLTGLTPAFYKRYSPAVASISKTAVEYNCIYVRF